MKYEKGVHNIDIETLEKIKFIHMTHINNYDKERDNVKILGQLCGRHLVA